MEVNQKESRRSTKGNKYQCRIQRIWNMARKITIRKRMERNMENTKMDEESHRWLHCNIEPKKVASVTAVQKKVLETRA